MVKDKIYLTGPITGLEELAKESFKRAEKNLAAMGYEVINPFNIISSKEEWQTDNEYWYQCMMECLPHIKGIKYACHVYTGSILRKNSIGSRIEEMFFDKMEIKCMIETPICGSDEWKYTKQ